MLSMLDCFSDLSGGNQTGPRHAVPSGQTSRRSISATMKATAFMIAAQALPKMDHTFVCKHLKPCPKAEAASRTHTSYPNETHRLAGALNASVLDAPSIWQALDSGGPVGQAEAWGPTVWPHPSGTPLLSCAPLHEAGAALSQTEHAAGYRSLGRDPRGGATTLQPNAFTE